ncbi:MAG: hypothetical protein FWJ70_11805 [Micromonosporaceae bacterium]|jgi:hypothetical protein
MIDKLLTPVFVAVGIGLVITIGLFFWTAATATGPGETDLALGPLWFVRIVRTRLESGSTVTVRPGPGLLVVWLLLLAYGATMAWRRYRLAAGAGR